MELAIDVLVLIVASIVIAGNIWSVTNLHKSIARPSLVHVLLYNSALLVCFAPCIVYNPNTYRNDICYLTVPRSSFTNVRVTIHESAIPPIHMIIMCIIFALAIEISALMIMGVLIDEIMEAFLVNMFIPIDPLTATVGYLGLILLLWLYTGILQYRYYKSWVEGTVLQKLKGSAS